MGKEQVAGSKAKYGRVEHCPQAAMLRNTAV